MIPGGVEIPGHHLRPVDGSQRLLDHRQLTPPGARVPAHRSDRMYRGQRHRKAAQCIDARPQRSRAQTRDRLQRNQRPARPPADAPLAFTVNRRSPSVVADPIPRDGPAAERKRVRLTGGSCHVNNSAAGIARRAASHQAVFAAMITAATPGTTASGARAASSGPGFGGYPPVSRASSAGNAKAMRIKAVSPVTPCLFSSTCRHG